MNHAPDVHGNALCDPLDPAKRAHVDRSSPVTCEPCIKRLKAG